MNTGNCLKTAIQYAVTVGEINTAISEFEKWIEEQRQAAAL